MPSGPFAESESRFNCKLSTLSGEKDTESTNSCERLGTESTNSCERLGKVGRESDGFGIHDLEATWNLAFSLFTCSVSYATI